MAGRQIKEIISLCEFPYAEVPFEKVINRPIQSCLEGILARRRVGVGAVYTSFFTSLSASKGRDKSVFSREATNGGYERIQTFFWVAERR